MYLKVFIVLLSAMILVGCNSKTSKYCEISVSNQSSVQIDEVTIALKLGDNGGSSASFGSLPAGTKSSIQKVWCSTRVTTTLSTGYYLTYEASISYLNGSPNSRDIFVGAPSQGLNESPDYFYSGESFLVTVGDSGVTFSKAK